MANTLKEHKIVDNQSRALIKYIYISDGTTTANQTLVDVSSLAYALNANGQIMSGNTHPKSTYRTTIKRLYINAGITGWMKLQWKGDTNNEIAIVKSGEFSFDMTEGGAAAIFPNNEANTNGDILISTFGQAANDVAMIIVDLKKDARDFDAGQTADPTAFNR